MLLYALTIFLSAFLLSQVQPIIAKIILPWFGGSSAVWTTCMLFFQSVLFLGYLEMGDARLALESEPPQQFDLLVMDGFSGDSAPVHLVTREAFRNYFRHLKPGGIVAVNVCNSYLNLRPVMAAAAAALGAMLYEFTPDDDDLICSSCSWVLLMDPATAAAHFELRNEGELLKPQPGFRIWTDDFSNLYGILM